MKPWRKIAVIAGLCAFPLGALACQPATTQSPVSLTINGKAYPVTTQVKTYQTPQGVVRVETLSWHGPGSVASIVSYSGIGQGLMPGIGLPVTVPNTMTPMRVMQTQLTRMVSDMTREFAAAFSVPMGASPSQHGLPSTQGASLMQAGVRERAKSPVPGQGAAIPM